MLSSARVSPQGPELELEEFEPTKELLSVFSSTCWVSAEGDFYTRTWGEAG